MHNTWEQCIFIPYLLTEYAEMRTCTIKRVTKNRNIPPLRTRFKDYIII